LHKRPPVHCALLKQPQWYVAGGAISPKQLALLQMALFEHIQPSSLQVTPAVVPSQSPQVVFAKQAPLS
jgi:hypothetical protein